jgi:ABC-type multidrug transport system fused ATPase/permease subunit
MGTMKRILYSWRRFATVAPADHAAVAVAPAIPLPDLLRRFWPDLRPYRRLLAVLLLLIALGPAIDAATIGLYGLLIDRVLVPRDFGPFAGIALAYLGLTLLDGVVSGADGYLSAWVGERFLLDLRTRLFAHLQDLPLRFFEQQPLGDVVARLTGDAAETEYLLLSGPLDAAAHLLRIAIFTVALLSLSWRLAALALVVAPVFWAAARVFAARMTPAARDQRRRSGGIGAVAEERLANAPLVQAYNRQQTEIDRFRLEAFGALAAELALARLGAVMSPLTNLIQIGGVLTIVGAGTWQLTRGELTLGALLAFVAYLNQLYDPVHGLSHVMTSVAAAAAGAERVVEALDQPGADQPRRDAAPVIPAQGAIAFEAVALRYPGAERDTLRDISLRVAPGQTIAIVGASGAGKSTLIKLLLRFAAPSRGRILFAGDNLGELDVAAVREQMAVVLQETLAFDGTIRENIAYGRLGATDDQIERAARAAGVHEAVMAMPEGYETRTGPRGLRLSRGQRQRVAIARAMLRDAPILILDEPTTGLDAAAAARLLAPLRRLMRGRTTIVVSHDPRVVREADRIVVLDDGRIVEQGSHAELVQRRGAYVHLFHLPEPDLAGAGHDGSRVPTLAGHG